MDTHSPGQISADDGVGGTGSQRSRARDSLFLMAKLKFAGDRRVFEVRVRNLSEGGLMAELNKVVDVDSPVLLEVRGIGEIEGKVAWCTQGRIGIAFDERIDPKLARKPVGVGATTPDYAKPIGL